MYRNSYKKGLLTIFYSSGIDPLRNWDVHRKDGYIKRIYEKENGMLVMEMRALNTTLHYISCPSLPKKNLGIGMPIVNLLIRNLNACFSFEIRVMDSANVPRRFRCANYIRRSTINLYETTIPLALCCDWVLIYFNLADFTRRCYNTDYYETERVQVNGNVHLRRIFFSDKVIEYNKLPKDYQLCTLIKDETTEPRSPRARPPSPVSFKSHSPKSRQTRYEKRSSKTPSISEVEVSPDALADTTLTGSQPSLNKQGSDRSVKSVTLVDVEGSLVVPKKSAEELPSSSFVAKETSFLAPAPSAENITEPEVEKSPSLNGQFY